MNVRRLCFATLLIVAWLAGPAHAARYDLSLGKYFSASCDRTCAQGMFNDLMIELGQVTAPVFLSPAETLGLNGFTFSFEGTVAPISKDASFWTMAAEGDPASVLFIPHIHVRKGLPFSFEIGTQLSYVPESELFLVGAEVKWALNEGFYYIPDLAVRVSMNHMVGAKDFELTTGGWDLSISKAFGIAGMLALTPYFGYNMLFIQASSHLVLQVNPDQTFTEQVFDEVTWNKNIHHRLFAGVRLTTFIFQVVVEWAGVIDGVNAFNFKLGFDY